jgi:hypothetical protein
MKRPTRQDALYRLDKSDWQALATRSRPIRSSECLPAHALPLSDFGSKRFIIYVFA